MKSSLQRLLACMLVVACATPAAGERTRAVHVYNAPAADAQAPGARTYFAATTADEVQIEAFRQRLAAAGARNVNWFAPDVIVCELPEDAADELVAGAVGFSSRSESEVTDLGSAPSPLQSLAEIKRAYQIADELRGGSTAPGASPSDDFRDAVFEASPERVRRIQSEMMGLPGWSSAGPDEIQRAVNQNSEILTGSIKVYMIFPESNGSIDGKTETWKNPDGSQSTEYVNARTHAFAALLDWQSQFAGMGISFRVIDMLVPCNYEPIHHNSSDDDLWIMDVLRTLEPDLGAIDDPLAAAHLFNEKRRGGYDWIFTSFIAHSRNEIGYRFRNSGYTAYAWLGGPYLVIPFPAGTDPNNIGENLVFSKIYQHEAGHVFWTLDEYPGAPGTCATTSGYLNYANLNVNLVGPNGIERCVPEVDCIMDQAPRQDVGRPFCRWSQGHLGVIDDNGNAIPDVFEKAPIIQFATSNRETLDTSEFTIQLTAISQAVTNRNRAFGADTRIDYAAPLRLGEFSIGGGWNDLSASDGSWDGMVETSSIHLTSLPPGLTEVKFRVRNAVGMWSGEYVMQVYFIGVNYSSLSAVPRDERIELRWEVVGDAFGALFDVYRVEPGEEIPDLRFLDPDTPLPGTMLAEHVPPEGEPVGGLTSYRFVDANVKPGVQYRYFVSGSGEVDAGNGPRKFRTPSHVVSETAMVPVPAGRMISHAAPNPFRSEITFSVSIPTTTVGTAQASALQTSSIEDRAPTRVRVAVYDVLGRHVKTLIDRDELRDVVTLKWDGTDSRSVPVSSGVYFVRVNAGPDGAVEKVLLIR